MKKVFTAVIFLLGIVLLGLAIGLPLVTTANSNIIGGADLPTFLFHFGKTSWMAVVGIILSLVAMFIRYE